MTKDDRYIKENYPLAYKCLSSIKCSIGLSLTQVREYKSNFRNILIGRVRFRYGVVDNNRLSAIMIWDRTPQGHAYWSKLNNKLPWDGVYRAPIQEEIIG